jgi:hypothetical protein
MPSQNEAPRMVAGHGAGLQGLCKETRRRVRSPALGERIVPSCQNKREAPRAGATRRMNLFSTVDRTSAGRAVDRQRSARFLAHCTAGTDEEE